MTYLSHLVREIRRDAAALPTGELRTEIGISIHVLEAFLDHYASIRPGAGAHEAVEAAGDVMDAALRTALYVRELTRRPAERVVARVHLSPN